MGSNNGHANEVETIVLSNCNTIEKLILVLD